MQITIGKVALTGEIPAENVQQFRLVSESQLQEARPIAAADVTLFPRGNKKVTLTFTIQRAHESAEEAAYFCLQHEAQFPIQDLLTYRTDTGELYQPNAVAAIAHGDFVGCTTTHAYRVTGGGFKTKPGS